MNKLINTTITSDDINYLSSLNKYSLKKTDKAGYSNCLSCEDVFKPVNKFNKLCDVCRKQNGYE